MILIGWRWSELCGHHWDVKSQPFDHWGEVRIIVPQRAIVSHADSEGLNHQVSRQEVKSFATPLRLVPRLLSSGSRTGLKS